MKRFGRAIVGNSLRSESPLEDSQIFNVAPSIFATEQHESRSERYVYIPTIEILNLLKKEGFYPFFVAQSKSRIPGKTEYTKHMIRLRPKDKITTENVGEIILVNSHDGTSSYKMMSGIFRFVCQNGLIAGDTIEDFKVYHKGDIKHEILEAAYSIKDNFDDCKIKIDRMKAIDLLPEEKEIFAESALILKYDEDEAPIVSDRLLTNRRYEDRGNDLWKTFNKVQENIIKGGLSGRTKNGKRTTTRRVNSIDSNVKLNRALWNLSERMAELKLGINKEFQAVN